MARIRTIKPEFFTSLTIADLTTEQRLTFIGLWTHVDDEGRCVDDPRLIKAALWPLDDRNAADIADDLRALSEASLITRYTLKPKRYLAVTNWHEHQKINRPSESKLPAPEQGEPTPPEPPTSTNADSWSTHAQLSEGSRQERKGRERNREGKGTPLPPTGEAVPASVAERMTAEFLNRFARGNSYRRTQVQTVITDALETLAADELWRALQRLGETSKPVTPGTLQFALSEIRKPTVVELRPDPAAERRNANRDLLDQLGDQLRQQHAAPTEGETA